jgi:hypothetical protein
LYEDEDRLLVGAGRSGGVLVNDDVAFLLRDGHGAQQQ